jgi:uncharacterized protein
VTAMGYPSGGGPEVTMTAASRSSAGRTGGLHVRTPRVGFDDVPRHWLAGSAAATHLANGVNLLFPAGERFFVRSVHRYLPDLEKDPAHAELAARVRGFFGQEGRHAQAHERFFDTLRAQGYPVDDFLATYEKVAYELIEKAAPPALRLATTVALEHFTAILAEDALSDRGAGGLVHAHPAMRALLEWHAVEEIEHKAVAFDVLRAVNPSYALRMAGLALGTATLGAFWIAGTRAFLRHDGLGLREFVADMRGLAAKAQARTGIAPEPIVQRVFVRGIRAYLRRDFHPDDLDQRELAAAALARLEEAGVVPRAEAA